MPKYKTLNNLGKRSLKRRFKMFYIQKEVPNNELIEKEVPNNEPIEKEGPNNEPISFVSEGSLNGQSCSESEESDFEEAVNCEDIKTFLVNWKFKHCVTNSALNDLLIFLRSNGHPTLPKDSRSLLQTPQARNTVDMPPGKYVHIGLQTSLINVLTSFPKNNLDTIILDFNVDGVPISKSSNSGFWLILARINNLPQSGVVVVGVYHGHNKPTCFLRPHIDELKALILRFTWNDKDIKIIVRCYICDAPARALLTGTKGHNSYFGCNKCVQEGIHTNYRMTFPETNANLRTNDSFRSRIDDSYHKTTSPLEELEFDMVKQIPLDYLHTVLLGVVKKLLKMWVSGDLMSKLPSIDITQISDILSKISIKQPKEIQRKIRPLSNLGHFKGTEFRTILLYAGPVAFRNILSPERYAHFMLLHLSIYILCSPSLCRKYAELARKMLIKFIEEMSSLYGEHHTVYNVHCLSHLVDDVHAYGTLDEFSSFPFESFMYQIKRLLHQNSNPLAELSNRIEEMNNAGYIKLTTKHNYPMLSKKKNIGSEIIYKEYRCSNFTLNSKSADSWFLTKSKDIFKFSYAIEDLDNEIFIYCDKIQRKQDFFQIPVKSMQFNIYESDGSTTAADIHKISINEIFCKLFIMVDDVANTVVFYPLMHSTS